MAAAAASWAGRILEAAHRNLTLKIKFSGAVPREIFAANFKFSNFFKGATRGAA